MKLIDAGDFDRAEKLLSGLLADIEKLPFAEQKLQTPLIHFKRGLCRYMLLKTARQTIDATSAVISSSEQEMHGSELVYARQLLVLSKQKRAHENQPETPSDEGIQPEHELANNAVSPQDSAKIAYLEAINKRSQAREQHQTFANGALKDLDIAVQFGNTELTTVYHLKGLVHMALLQYADAIDNFTRALQWLQAPLPGPETTDNQQVDEFELAPTIPEPSIRIFLCRAEAYRGLGQLPSAIMDIRHVISRYPIQLDSADIETLEAEYTHVWEAQQAACAIDDATLLRAFDVKASSGLARRPEVHDIHAEVLAAATAKNKSAKNQVKAKRLPPDERFQLECATKIEALESAKQQRRAPFEAISDRSRVFLNRARDFKREIRATLEMKIEENRQRQVEQEIAREAERKRLELQNEVDERMVMKYEDEWMHWFVNEELRVEEERRRRVEETQRRTDAKAAYATRLSKRGGKRQAAAQRGKGDSRHK
ncbi:hypothetical protein BBJ29_008568 [Phytophthora kernoviae]|uniref:Uncharacterized protein n=1 Tax=Phytophthora kernoviae TaxID=325452 RepID=A0A3F2RF53_9STRA|nr:hypothetical protein BBJ29_008568 [Phytophthora kernoviae]RLN55304.1 hypothetical protein BBP00_00008551 [Phytophthora kernoviae]